MKSGAIVVVAVFAVVFSPGSVAYAQDHAQYYVLDAFGGVHAGGGAPVITPATPYFGFDVAANVEYVAVGTSVAVGDGYIVLDKFGGVHYGGALAADPPPGGTTPYFGFDAARSVVRRDAPSRIVSATQSGAITLSTASPTYTVLATANITAPIDGWLYVTGTSHMGCAGSPGEDLVAFLDVNVDATTEAAPPGQGLATVRDCTVVTASNLIPTANRTVSIVVAVTAGSHAVNLLGRKEAGTGSVRFLGRSVTAKFIAHDALGGMSLPAITPTPVADLSAFRVLR